MVIGFVVEPLSASGGQEGFVVLPSAFSKSLFKPLFIIYVQYNVCIRQLVYRLVDTYMCVPLCMIDTCDNKPTLGLMSN